MSDKNHNEIEVSAHHTIHGNALRDHVEFEVHTGWEDEYRVSEELSRRVYAELGLDLENGDYRSGCEVVVVPEKEASPE